MAEQVNTFRMTDASAPPSLANQACDAIRDMLVTLEIPPGAAISEEALMGRLCLGRTPVHEAIKRLEAESLVAIYPRRGTFATEVNITDLALITEIRLALEPSAAHSAARRCTPAEREELGRLLEACDNLDGTDEQLMRLDRDVHYAIYHCAHNRYLEGNLRQYYSLVRRIWYLFLDRLPNVTEHIAEHKALLEAIIEGQADDAHRITHEHVSSFEQTIRSIL